MKAGETASLSWREASICVSICGGSQNICVWTKWVNNAVFVVAFKSAKEDGDVEKWMSLYLLTLKPPFWTVWSKNLLFDAHTKKTMCCHITGSCNSTMNYIYIRTTTKDQFQLFLSGLQTTGRKQSCFFLHWLPSPTTQSPGCSLYLL